MSPAKTAEPIDLAFGSWTRIGRRKHKVQSYSSSSSSSYKRANSVIEQYRTAGWQNPITAYYRWRQWTVRLRRRCDLM